MTEAKSPRKSPASAGDASEVDPVAPRSVSVWHQRFLENLGETSNVSQAARVAGITTSEAYHARRTDSEFAGQWRAALLEGYEHLEMETLHRLRMGVSKDDPKFDIANALRLLSLHKDSVASERSARPERDEEAIFASIDAKIDKMRARERNVTRLLDDQGIQIPHVQGGNE